MIVATYARVSTDRQEKEETIQSQIAAVKQYTKDKGYTIVKEYKDDGWSGTILARPGLDELRDDATKKIWEAVVLYDPDRLARKYSYQELIMDEMSDLGVDVLFVTTPPAKTDEDKIMNGFRGLFAEYERLKIAERMRRGKLHKARSGHVVTSQAPYGYDYIPKQGDKHGYYKVNIQEAEVIKMVFAWVANEGITVRTVARRLKKLNVKPRKSKRNVWSTSTLSTLLKRKDYIGITYYNRSYAVIPENPLKKTKYKKIKKSSRKFKPKDEWIEIKAPSIIEKSLYEKAQKQLKENYELLSRNVKNQYLLSGKIYCTCGRRRTGEGPQQGKHLYYRCTDRVHRHPLPRQCFEKGINARVVDKLVWDRVSDYMTNPKVLKRQVKRWMSDQVKTTNEKDVSVSTLERELAKIKSEEQRYIKAYGAEMINADQLKDSTEDLKKKRKLIEQQISNMQSEVVTTKNNFPSDTEIDKFCGMTYNVVRDLRFEAKQAIIRKTIDTIVGTQTNIRVYGHLPINTSIIATCKKGDIQEVEYESESRHCRAS